MTKTVYQARCNMCGWRAEDDNWDDLKETADAHKQNHPFVETRQTEIGPVGRLTRAVGLKPRSKPLENRIVKALSR